MKPEQFGKLPQTPDGRPIVTLLQDPDMNGGFVSLVSRGANGRRISVTKAETVARDPDPGVAPGSSAPEQPMPPRAVTKADDESTTLEVVSHLGPGTNQAERGSWFFRVFAPLLGLMGVAKADKPLTFDAAIASTKLREARWQATDALWDVIRAVLEDEATTDKVAAITVALDQFKAHVLALVAATPVSKAEDRQALAEAIKADPGWTTVQKAGKVLSGANMAKVEAALSALAALQAELKALQAAGSPPDTASKEDDVKLDVQQLTAVAKAAADTAILVAKGAGVTDPAKLADLGVRASQEVMKAAVQGPAQPGIPTRTLEDQAAMAGPTGSMPMPEDQLLAVINRALGNMATKGDSPLGQLVAKVDALTAAVEGAGEGTGRVPGIRDVVAKQGEALTRLARIPEASAQGAETPVPESVKKALEDAETDRRAWQGSAFDLGMGGRQAGR